MSDDPFAEPSDADATVIRPRGGGAASGARAEPPPRASAAAAPDAPTVGINPLVAAAAPLLAAAIRIGAAPGPGSGQGPGGRNPDPERLKRGMIEAIRAFEKRALATGLDTRSLRSARYALCATVDDLVLSTPWGAASSWPAQSLTSIFHNEVSGGERFYEILQEMEKDLGRHGEVVELMYLCMSLGFEGRYRVMPRGGAALAELRDGVHRTMRQRRGEFERALSPHWRGLQVAHASLGRGLPIWATAVGTLAVLCLIYALFNFSLAGASDAAYAELNALPPHGPANVPRAAVAVPPPPPALVVATPGDFASKLHRFLEPEIRAGLVQVLDDPQAITVRLTARNMFGSGSGVLNPAALPLLQRIGTALQDEKGDVAVNGYTDNQPIHTVQFPSNWKLSQARADAVARVIASRLDEPRRVQAVGKADSDPIASNATAEGRQANRRTEIVLFKTASAP